MSKISILVVDDELHNLTAFKSSFRRMYQVHTANSAKEGLEILKKENIQVIITDQRMPDMTGVAFLTKVAPLYPQVARVVLSGFSNETVIAQAIKQKLVHRYVTKPWQKESLQQVIDQILGG
jgi:response regulator RpfG family c-di-GMP phosphodiesterase